MVHSVGVPECGTQQRDSRHLEDDGPTKCIQVETHQDLETEQNSNAYVIFQTFRRFHSHLIRYNCNNILGKQQRVTTVTRDTAPAIMFEWRARAMEVWRYNICEFVKKMSMKPNAIQTTFVSYFSLIYVRFCSFRSLEFRRKFFQS